MNFYQISSLVLILLCLSSCNALLKTAYGIKKPKLETLSSIHAFEHEHGLDSTKTITFKDFSSFITASQQGFITIPDAIFFNEEGHFVSYNKTAQDCNANVDSFIKDMDTFDTYPVNETIKLSDFTQLLTPNILNNGSQTGIHVFITWTTYAGKMNDEKGFEWVNLLEEVQSNGANVNYHLLNCDYLESWNIPKEVQKKLGIKS